MKIRFCAALLLAAFCATLFAGCASANALGTSPAAPEITISAQSVPKTDLPDPTPAATPAATGPAHTLPRYISKEEAKNVALNHAGLSAADVTRLRAEFDYDHGVPEFEVDFRVGNWEYDYEIHAETGEIIKWNKERDD